MSDDNDRRGFMTKLLGGAVAAGGTMWLPPALRAKVEEEGVKNLTLDELNEAFQALSKRVSDLEERIAKLEAEDEPEKRVWDSFMSPPASAASGKAFPPGNTGFTIW